jgi:hypothetical protein
VQTIEGHSSHNIRESQKDGRRVSKSTQTESAFECAPIASTSIDLAIASQKSLMVPMIDPEISVSIQEDQRRIENISAVKFPHPPADDEETLIRLKSVKFRRNYSAWGLAILSAVVSIFTAIYTWEAILPAPKLLPLLWNNSQTTILTINILGYLTMLFIDSLVSTACDNLRWALCRRGIGLLNFVALAGSTSSLGLLQLIFSRRLSPGVDREGHQRDDFEDALSYRLWSIQR